MNGPLDLAYADTDGIDGLATGLIKIHELSIE